MGCNIKSPVFKDFPLVLLLTDHHSHFRFLHPAQLALDFLAFLLGGTLQRGLQRRDGLLPVFLHEVVHTDAGHLVDAHEHSLARSPHFGVVPHKILRDGAQSLFSRENMDVLCQLAFQFLCLFTVHGFAVE